MMSKLLMIFVCISFFLPLKSQNKDFFEGGTLTGNLDIKAQYYLKDSVIGAPDVPEKVLSNGSAEIQYRLKNFTTGMRYEYYLNPMIGTQAEYKGDGIANYYATYANEQFEITLGNFYEQFGSGLIFRTYRDPALGLDNSLRGALIKYMPLDGLTLKALMGKQRYYWEYKDNLVRGVDADFSLNDGLCFLKNSKLQVALGASFISKHQEQSLHIVGTNKINFPENVAATAGRASLRYDKFSLEGEYAYKINDPSALNGYLFRPGQALLLTGTYSKKGLGIMLVGKRVDNMSFKSDNQQQSTMLNLNYLPSTTRQHAYALPAIYPCETQANGEMAFQADVTYTIPRGSAMGGKYGAEVRVNYSRVNSIERNWRPDAQEGTYGYDSPFLKVGKERYYQDFNVELTKKLNRSTKASMSYINLWYNKSVLLVKPNEPNVKANVLIGDLTYNIDNKKSVRMEAQHLWTKQDEGNWAYLSAEYTIAPNWFFSVSDMYNYGVSNEHYYSFVGAYTMGASRIQLGYGRTRAGLDCSGGVCLYKPATNGFNIAISSTF